VAAHLEEQLQRDVDRIRDKVREMANLALRALEDCVKALVEGDTRLAYSSIIRDSRIDDLEKLIDGMCVEFMVRHIPVAANLRFAHSVAKIVLELERIGDYAESINRQAILLSRAETRPDLTKIEALAQVAIEMVRQASRAFLDQDAELARVAQTLDARANSLHQEVYRDLLGYRPTGSEDLSTLFSVLSVANRFERVADQADNICDEVRYIETGQDNRHVLTKDIQVLFVSSSNSCRSLMAEGIGKTIAGDHFDFLSAGVDAAAPDPGAVKFLAEKSIDLSDHKATTVTDLGPLSRFKVVVAIGEEAAAAISTPGYKTIVLEWDVLNPLEATADDQERQELYAVVFDDLLGRISSLIRGLHGTASDLD
jgi:phosphate transport system protein